MEMNMSAAEADELLGKPWLSVLSRLEAAGVAYTTQITAPPKPSKIFPLDNDNLYVVRVKSGDITEVTLAARMRPHI
jgi:hypothetical protein